METSILKASQVEAEKISTELLLTNKKSGKNIFKRVELPELEGFEILAPYKENGKWVLGENGKAKRKVIFRFTNYPGPKVSWDKDVIVIE